MKSILNLHMMIAAATSQRNFSMCETVIFVALGGYYCQSLNGFESFG